MFDLEAILNEEIIEYNFTTIVEMDNVWSMDRFIKDFDLGERVTLWDGTYVEIDGLIGCHSGGNGDFYSHKIKFEIHKPNNNDPIPDPEFRDAQGNYSVIAKGSYNGVPFIYKSKKSAHQILSFPNNLVITESAKTNVTLKVNPYTWFISNGVYLDPTDTANENDIDNNIKDSFKAFKDDDKNGIPD